VKRFDVRLRLGGTFCLLAAVLFVVGWQGVRHLRQLDRETQNAIYDRWSEEQQVREAFGLSDLNSRVMLSILLLDDPDEIKRLLVQRAANTGRISELVHAIEARLNTEEEKRLLSAVEAARKPYVESYKQALAKLLDEHQRGEAQKMMVRVALPRIAVYHAAWNAFAQCQIDKIEQGIKQSKADFAAARRRLLFMIMLALLITSATAVYVTCRVTREIAERQRAENDLLESHDQLEQRVRQRTAELAQSNQALQAEITERKHAEEELRLKTAFLEAQVNSSLDGILVVDQNRNVSLQNRRFIDLFKMPLRLADTGADEIRLRWVTDRIKNSEPFVQKVLYLYAHPNEISRDEIELNDGTILDRYSSPAIGKDGKYYGRIWTYRDITERKRTEEELRLKTAFLEAQVNSSIDGILVVDEQDRKILQNQRTVDLLKIPRHIADDKDDEKQRRWVMSIAKHPAQFIERVIYLNSHPNEISRDELELKDGTILDRYSSPATGKDGKYYGRVWIFRDITERKRDEEALRKIKLRLAHAMSLAQLFAWEYDVASGLFTFSDAYYALHGTTAALENGCLMSAGVFARKFLHPDDAHLVAEEIGKAMATTDLDYHSQREARIFRRDGKLRHVLVHIAITKDAAGRTIQIQGANQDITERKQLEGKLFQSQKMETVGKLAGGIAHEFNSILTAIIGQSELLLCDLPTESPLATSATEISKAANRAAALTRQLLAYGRKQILQPEPLDLNKVIASTEGMIHHLVGGAVDVYVVPAPGLHAVKADAGQIEQVVMNVAINAADAMPHGGKLTLETGNVTLDQEYVSRFSDLKAGGYVMLAVTDTGVGMSEEVKARVFEPFFTTKGVGQGTGLGLSTCYGILKQSGGHMDVYSELGRGTTFKIYLPQVEQQAIIPAPRLAAPDLPRGTETVLLVEDDPALREMAAMLLRRLGYTVLPAANGIEALTLIHQRDTGHIDLLFTDVIMPHMSGKELADRVQASYPHTRILFTSACTGNAIVHQGVLDKGVALLQKPFTPSALAHKLREMLDQPIAPLPDSAQK
jgi:signal transduction histidine kinase